MFENVIKNSKRAIQTIESLNSMDLTRSETIAVAQVYALLAVAAAIYEGSDFDKVAKAIEYGFDSIATEIHSIG